MLGVVGTPGGYGGAVLGLGVAITLHDLFTKASYRIQRRMQAMEKTNSSFVKSFRVNLGQLTTGVTIASAGIAGLATLAYPVKSAIEFQNSLALTFSIFDEGQRKMMGGFDGFRTRMEDLAAIFPQTANDLTQVYDDIVRADIAPELAFGFVEVGSKLAIANETPLMDSVNAIISFAQAFGMGIDEDLGAEISLNRMYRVADILTAAMDKGRFSDTSLSDFTQVAKYMGQGLAMATGVGLTPEEFMAAWASATMVGQPARRAGTGIRQMMTNILQKTGSTQLGNFMDYAMQEFGYDMTARSGVGIDMAAFIRTEGLDKFLEAARGYAGAGVGFDEAMSSELVQQQLEDIFQALDEGIIDEAAALAKVDTIIGGQLDVAKLMELVPSVWGLAAFLPLVTSQFEGYKETLAYIQNSEDLLESRFQELMATVKNLWARLTSQMNTLVNIWVFPLLDDIGAVLSQLISLVDGLIAFSRRFEGVITVIVRVLAFASMFLTVTGIFVAAIAAWNVASKMFFMGLQSIAASATLWGRFAGWLSATFGAGALGVVIKFVLILAAAVTLLTYAWRENLFGFRDWVQAFVGQLEPQLRAISEFFSTLNEFGEGRISTELFTELYDLGVLEHTLAIISVLYRLQKFMSGFIDGLMFVFDNLRNVWNWIVETVGTLGIEFKWFGDWLERIGFFTQENVDGWYRVGKFLAVVITSMLLLSKVIIPVLNGFGAITLWLLRTPLLLARFSSALARAMVGIFVAMGPVGWIVSAVIVVVGALVWAYRNVEWFKDSVDQMGVGLKTTADGLKDIVQGLKEDDESLTLEGVARAFDGSRESVAGFNAVMGKAMGFLGRLGTWLSFGNDWFMSGEEIAAWWDDFFVNATAGYNDWSSRMEAVTASGFSLIHAIMGGDPDDKDAAWGSLWTSIETNFPLVSAHLNEILNLSERISGTFSGMWDNAKSWWGDRWTSIESWMIDTVGGQAVWDAMIDSFTKSSIELQSKMTELWNTFGDIAAAALQSIWDTSLGPIVAGIENAINHAKRLLGMDVEPNLTPASYYLTDDDLGLTLANRELGVPSVADASNERLSELLTAGAVSGIDLNAWDEFIREFAQGADSDGGAVITEAEFNRVMTALEAALERDIVVEVDGRNLFRVVKQEMGLDVSLRGSSGGAR